MANNLKSITLLKERVKNWNAYPFSVPTIRSLAEITIKKQVCFFVGENGTGKSTLLESIATYAGYGKEGGSKNIQYKTTSYHHNQPTTDLANVLRLSWSRKLTNGYFLRAESFFNIATYLDDLDREDGSALFSYGDKSLHEQSHGESFLSLFQHRFSRNGFYLLDEPEAALSPQRQLSFLIVLDEILKNCKESQFIIATHSPIILAYPNAQILSFNNSKIQETTYEETEVYKVTSSFLSNPKAYLHHLLAS